MCRGSFYGHHFFEAFVLFFVFRKVPCREVIFSGKELFLYFYEGQMY